MTRTVEALSLERSIWLIRGQRVMLDSDLAELYGVSTKRLNEQVRRNVERFPERYAFQLNRRESLMVMRSRRASQTAVQGRYRKYLPLAFTEHGAVMLASVLKSPRAVQASLQVVDAFVRLRTLIAERDGLGRKVEALERRLDEHSGKIEQVFDVLKDLLDPPAESAGETAPPRKIGFRPE